MANWNRWAVAGGLAGALAVFGPAWAQNGPGAATAPGAPGTGTSNTTDQSAGAPRDSGRSMSDSNNPPSSTGNADQSANNATSTGSSDRATGTASTSDTAAGSSSASAKSSGKVDKKLQEDVQKIHAANEAEVHMGQMGAQQASSPEVKEFAEKLERDHKRLDEQLQQTAQSAGIQLEGKGYQSEQKDAQKTMKKLEGKSGQDFDKEFVSMMVKDHEKDIKATEKAAKEAKKQHQTELASLLDQAVTGMKGHLEQAKQLKDTLGKNKSARGSKSGSSSTGSGSSGGSSMGSGSTGGSSSTGTGSSYGGATNSSPSGTSGGSSSQSTGNTSDTSSQSTQKSGSGQ
jgi:putative membrane protein